MKRRLKEGWVKPPREGIKVKQPVKRENRL
jgi:hypothetical protein